MATTTNCCYYNASFESGSSCSAIKGSKIESLYGFCPHTDNTGAAQTAGALGFTYEDTGPGHPIGTLDFPNAYVNSLSGDGTENPLIHFATECGNPLHEWTKTFDKENCETTVEDKVTNIKICAVNPENHMQLMQLPGRTMGFLYRIKGNDSDFAWRGSGFDGQNCITKVGYNSDTNYWDVEISGDSEAYRMIDLGGAAATETAIMNLIA